MAVRKSYHEFDGKTFYCGLDELRFLLNPQKPYSKQTISNWIKKGLPFEMRGKIKKFNFKSVYEWLYDNEENLDALDIRLKKARAELLDVKIEREELKKEEEKGALIPIDKVSSSQASIIELLRQKDEMHLQRSPKEIKDTLDKHYKEKWDDFLNVLEKNEQDIHIR